MIDNRSACFGGKTPKRDNVCVDTMQILDSCKDKDCYEDVRVYLTDFGQDVIEKTGNVKVKDTKVLGVNVQADPVPFNRGFYQITCRVYTKVVCEACLCPGKTQEIEGVAVTEKKVVLYGGEGCARVFKSLPDSDGFCPEPCDFEEGSNRPTVVFETVDPMALSCAVKEKCRCKPCRVCACPEELPQAVLAQFQSCPVDHPGVEKYLTVSLGFFSVMRVERPAQFVLSAEEYRVPDKECPPYNEEDPCAVFAKMAFPTAQFCSCLPGASAPEGISGGCGCRKDERN